jgi:uncharacterized protein YjbJ (UPF0337 family)
VGSDDKTGNAAGKLGANDKDAPGEARGDDNLQAERPGNQAKSGLVQGGEKANDAPGDATKDENLKAEGQGDQAKSGLVQGGENTEDAF